MARNWEIDVKYYDFEDQNCNSTYKKLKGVVFAAVKCEVSPMEIDEVLDDYFTIKIDEMEKDGLDQGRDMELCFIRNGKKVRASMEIDKKWVWMQKRF